MLMKKNNKQTSKRKVKRSIKNKKRLSQKKSMSKFEKQQQAIRESIMAYTLANMNKAQ
jgi:hypothetical protein